MASTELPTTVNNGSLSSTNSPQTSVPANGISGGSPSSIQPGTANDLLTSKNGIPLSPGPLTTVSVGTTKSQPVVAAKNGSNIHPGLFIFALFLFVVALGMFYATSRADKTTTAH